jgi:hypothetical protein
MQAVEANAGIQFGGTVHGSADACSAKLDGMLEEPGVIAEGKRHRRLPKQSISSYHLQIAGVASGCSALLAPAKLLSAYFCLDWTHREKYSLVIVLLSIHAVAYQFGPKSSRRIFGAA